MAELVRYRCTLCGATLEEGSVKAHYTKLHPKATAIKATQISATEATRESTKLDPEATGHYVYWYAK